MDEFVCDPDEEVTAVLALKSGHLVVGTVRHQIGETEPSSGRLLLFMVEPGEGPSRGERGRSLNLRMITSVNSEGCVYALAEVQGAIAAAVNTSVSLV